MKAASEFVAQGAEFSPCHRYRYRLWREWRGTHDPKNWQWHGFKDGAGHECGDPKSCVFVMLNPSTADATVLDPTIRRCIGFAKSWRYERIEILNLFAWRATKPRDLFAVDDPVGVGNQRAFDQVIPEAGLVVGAWGAHGTYLDQHETARGWIPHNVPLYALGYTQGGQPRHPLYLKADSKLGIMNP